MRRGTVLALLVSLALAIQPVQVVAQTPGDPAEVEGFGWKKFFDYGLCAASIAVATGTGTWVAVVFTCGRVIQEHWTD